MNRHDGCKLVAFEAPHGRRFVRQRPPKLRTTTSVGRRRCQGLFVAPKSGHVKQRRHSAPLDAITATAPRDKTMPSPPSADERGLDHSTLSVASMSERLLCHEPTV
jgi:hypothetical protein